MRIDRLLAITVMLLNRRRVTARELADYFDVSVRTVYRDIEAIMAAGIPIMSFQGNTGGFGIMENYKLNRQLLTFQDMTAILTALKGVNATFRDRSLDGAIEKISALIPDDKEDDYRRHSERFIYDVFPLWGESRQRQVLETVRSAVISDRLLRFSYRNAKGEYSERLVEPMTLVCKRYHWYLFAYCRMREDYRVFRLSRLREPVVLDETFARREKSFRDVEQPDTAALPTVRLRLKFAPAVRVHVEDFYDDESITVQPDGSLVVDVTFPEDPWVYSHILSFGEMVQVLEPAHIRRIIEDQAIKIQKNHQT